ncbi:unnamed protein product [Rhizoctonia solani]|uniref:Uncharacterized protein n=1 Tax=Rhizoctonia solani TaxID=456999 RepID=A0A8H2XF73_9AGAM|nr:unnamed protein product [Rhizoctonia solani]
MSSRWRSHLSHEFDSSDEDSSPFDRYRRQWHMPAFERLPYRDLGLESVASVYSGETAVDPSSYATSIYSYPRSASPSNVEKNINIGIVDKKTCFDYVRHGTIIAPRSVREMQWCTEQSGDADEFIILRIEDEKNGGEVYVRFKSYSGGGTMGDTAHSISQLLTPDMSSHATLSFEKGIDYQAVVDIRMKMSLMHRIPVDGKKRAFLTAEFVEMLSLHIGEGVSLCTPQDLCEIWPSVPTSDRRLFELRWYEIQDGSGAEFIVLLINGSSDLSSYEDWWVRLERVEMSDQAAISMRSDAVIHPGSALKHRMTFDDGVPFGDVIDVLRSVPIGLNPVTEDSWFYASTIAHKISMQVGDDLGECSINDLKEIWSGERGSQMLVNRTQSFTEQEAPGISSQFLLFNISLDKHDRRGLWVRFGKSMDGDEDSASISKCRRRLLSKGSNLDADAAFEDLKFGEMMSTPHRINAEREAESQRKSITSIGPEEIIRRLSQTRDYVYWFRDIKPEATWTLR